MMKEGFNSEMLHDAILRNVKTDWRNRICSAEVTLVGGRQVAVVWPDVADVTIPHVSPWGESECINAARSLGDGTFEIEMQSGDVITIKAGEPEMR